MTNQTDFIVAVDGGGTKTTVWISDNTGVTLGQATTGPMSLAATSEAKACEHFLSAVDQAMDGLGIRHFSKVVVGLAGVDTVEEVQKATEIFSFALKEKYQFTDFLVLNDTSIALASGTSSPNAICLISGTGSNCVGKNEAGQTAKTGGMDYLLSDQGSGFDIGQQVLRAAVKSFDGRSAKTVMEKLVCQHFEIDSVEQLKNKVYHPLLNKTQIGQLSAICFAAKDQQDTLANEIINDAIEEMMDMVLTILKKLDLASTPTDLVLIGGIATDPYIKSQLEIKFHANYPQLNLVVPEHPPVYGALQIALES